MLDLARRLESDRAEMIEALDAAVQFISAYADTFQAPAARTLAVSFSTLLARSGQMNPRHLTALALALAVLAVLVLKGCAVTPAMPTVDTSLVTVKWGSERQVAEGCAAIGLRGASACSSQRHLKDSTICEITTVRPSDWHDGFWLSVLGEELLHCLGATH